MKTGMEQIYFVVIMFIVIFGIGIADATEIYVYGGFE